MNSEGQEARHSRQVTQLLNLMCSQRFGRESGLEAFSILNYHLLEYTF